MKMKKILAAGLACFLLMGQEVYAEDSGFYTENAEAVEDTASDAVPFKDEALRDAMVKRYDSNGDGYISFDEIESLQDLDLRNSNITDLSGLEYAVNVRWIDLDGNTELEDISPIKNLVGKKLVSISLKNTAVSDEARFEAANFQDFIIAKGACVEFPSVRDLFEEAPQVEIKESAECFQKKEFDDVSRQEFLGVQEGTSVISITYHDCTTDILGTVEGIPYHQEVGPDYEGEVVINEEMNYTSFNVIHNSNGDLWKVYPEVEKVASDAKDFLAEWVFSGLATIDGDEKDRTWIVYYLDSVNTLWSGDTKLAENVIKFDSRYALDAEGTLTDVFNDGTAPIYEVEDWWTSEKDGYSSVVTTHILKKDGTLWERQEVAKSEAVNEFVKVEENVQAVSEKGYLKDGQYLRYSDKAVLAENVVELVNYKTEAVPASASGVDDSYLIDDGFYTADGHLHLDGVDFGDVGKLKNYRWAASDADYLAGGLNYGRFIQNTEDELYLYDKEMNKTVQIASGVKSFYFNWNVAAQLSDGSYYGTDGEVIHITEDSPVVIQTNCNFLNSYNIEYELIENVSGEKIVRKNGIELLDHVVKFWSEGTRYERVYFALRTDGTIWNITGVPEMVLDLAQADYKRGDVNEDGEVDIQDLRIVLRGVCEKIELTERQKKIADVVEDGQVDIQDLRKELRYVCGKITEL